MSNLSVPSSLELLVALRDVVEKMVIEHCELLPRELSIFLTLSLGQAPRPIVSGFAKCLNIPKPAVTRALDGLVAHGLIERISTSKKRYLAIQVTQKGEALVCTMRMTLNESVLRGRLPSKIHEPTL